MLHRTHYSHPRIVTHFNDFSTVSFEPGSLVQREQVQVGDYRWSVQASHAHRCSPAVNGDPIPTYSQLEIAGWTSAHDPIDSKNDIHFYGFGLELLQRPRIDISGTYGISSIIIYDNVPFSIFYRVMSHCLLLKQAQNNSTPLPVTTKLTGCHCVKCKEYFPMSEPNLPNGTMKCYSCRSSVYH